MKHLIHAAERGDAAAQFNLGVLYDNRLDDSGHTVASRRAETLKWLQLAARQGLGRAQGKLAEVYVKWPSTPANDVKACAWFLLAIENSIGAHRQRAQAGYDQVLGRLEPDKVATAERLARRWRAGYAVTATEPADRQQPARGRSARNPTGESEHGVAGGAPATDGTTKSHGDPRPSAVG